MDDGAAVGFVEGIEGEARPKGKGTLPKIAIPGIVILALLVVFGGLLLVRNFQLKAANDAKRQVFDQMFKTVDLKWKLEADCTKECEERFALLRNPDSAKHLNNILSAENPENGFRLWVYAEREFRNKVLDGNLENFQKFFNAETDGLAYAKAGENKFYAEDLVLDWLANRGYAIYENLKKTGANPNLAAGGTIDSEGNGAVRLTLFGATLTAECVPEESSMDIDRGMATIAFTTNYLALLGTGTAPAKLYISGVIKDNRWTFDFTKELSDHVAASTGWATKRFNAGGGAAGAK
jgi:hypothetical protein